MLNQIMCKLNGKKVHYIQSDYISGSQLLIPPWQILRLLFEVSVANLSVR